MCRLFFLVASFCTFLNLSAGILPEARVFYYPEINVVLLYCPKCASTFVRNCFSSPKFHKPCAEVPIKKSTIILLVVRNPYTRCISSYLEVCKARKDCPWKVIIKKDYYLNKDNTIESFNQNLMDIIHNGFYDPHTIPQYSAFADKKIDMSKVSFIADVEHIEEDLALFSKLFNIKLNLSVSKYGGIPSKKNVLLPHICTNSKTRKLIETIYGQDFIFYAWCRARRLEILKSHGLIPS